HPRVEGTIIAKRRKCSVGRQKRVRCYILRLRRNVHEAAHVLQQAVPILQNEHVKGVMTASLYSPNHSLFPVLPSHRPSFLIARLNAPHELLVVVLLSHRPASLRDRSAHCRPPNAATID